MSGGPENFVNFADYLGLNDEAGQSMLNRTLNEGAGENNPDKIRQLSGQHWNAARAAGETDSDGGVFERTGEATQKGLASYSAFMKGMNDPAEREALLRKTYGGSVNRFDSMLAGYGGGGAGLRQANQDLGGLTSDVGNQTRRADLRKVEYQQSRKDQAEQEAAYQKKKQDEADAREEERIARQFSMDEFDDVDQANPAYRKLTDQEKNYQIQMRATHLKARGADGRIDWRKYREGTRRMQAEWDAGSANDVSNWGVVKDAHKFFTNLTGNAVPEKHKPEAWESYYARKRTQGAK